jgi:hypothetical protein
VVEKRARESGCGKGRVERSLSSSESSSLKEGEKEGEVVWWEGRRVFVRRSAKMEEDMVGHVVVEGASITR